MLRKKICFIYACMALMVSKVELIDSRLWDALRAEGQMRCAFNTWVSHDHHGLGELEQAVSSLARLQVSARSVGTKRASA